VVADAIQHGRIEGVQSQDPVQLVDGKRLQLFTKGRIPREGEFCQPRCGRDRSQARILTLPPRSRIAIVGEEEAGVARSRLVLYVFAAVTEWVIHLGSDRELKRQRLSHRV